MTLKSKNTPPSSERRGFAIVMALSLLSLVFLLVISLVNLVGVDLSLGESRKQKALAQAHARMGMMVAIGEIQKHLGPDTRVSATADILDERIESGRKFEAEYYSENNTANLGQMVAENQAIDLNENNVLDTVPFGQRYWTGVWKHRARRKGASEEYRAAAPLPKNLETGKNMDSTPMADTEYDPHPAIEASWLVSGNEGWSKKFGFFNGSILQEYVEVPDGIRNEDGLRQFIKGGVYGKSANAWRDYQMAIDSASEEVDRPFEHPLFDLDDPDDEASDTVWILRRPLLEEPISEEDKESGQWRNKLHGEPVKVSKTHILPDDPLKDRLNSHGSYAYWVGDEGVKTKLNVALPRNNQTDQKDATLSMMDDITIAKKPNINFPGATGISAGSYNPGESGFGLEFSSNAERSKTLSVRMASEEGVLKGEATEIPKKLAAHYHSLTTDSHGVLADVRTGGLKRDLSHAFANDLPLGKDWDETLEGSTLNWIDDFLGFIYRDRVHVLKEIPMHDNAKANEWNDNSASEPINDYKGILSGPLWRTIASFHNLYLKVLPVTNTIKDKYANALPRFTGDNVVIFDPREGEPKAGGVPFWRSDNRVNPMVKINTRINWFRERGRPGPKSHPIQPVLMEFKFSQVPTVSDGNLALAMHPSVALWNPYNVRMSMKELYLEVPIHRSEMHTMNPKEYDRWRKWYMWSHAATQPQGKGGMSVRPAPGMNGKRKRRGRGGPVGMGGVQGVWGYSAKSLFYNISAPSRTYTRPILNSRNFFKSCFNEYTKLNAPRQEMGFVRRVGAPDYVVLEEHRKYRNKYVFLHSNKQINQDTLQVNAVKERHLLLKIEGLFLDPGEKAHFTVEKQTVSQHTAFNHSSTERDYLQISLKKNPIKYDSNDFAEYDTDAFICRTDLTLDPSDQEPLMISSFVSDVEGIHPKQISYYNPMDASPYRVNVPPPEPKGITMYSDHPHNETEIGSDLYKAYPSYDRYPIFKVTKNFSFNSGHDDWVGLNKPIETLNSTLSVRGDGDYDSRTLAGNGFRIRYKLPGTADRIVFEQYNIRAMVNSYQDGSGDNWQVEYFNSAKFMGENLNIFEREPNTPAPTYIVYIHDDPNESDDDTDEGSAAFQRDRFADFYHFKKSNKQTFANPRHGIYEPDLPIEEAIIPYDLTDITQAEDAFDIIGDAFKNDLINGNAIDLFNGDRKIVPKISKDNYSNSIGFFHDDQEAHGSPTIMNTKNSAILFEIPNAPMLSILQLRHANLSDYSHGPSYILGNSNAPPQVGRYKTWGRVKSIAWQTSSTMMEPSVNAASKVAWDMLWPMSPSPWSQFLALENVNPNKILAPVRKVEAQSEHQNTTLDHSFYANRALLDGYMMSGVGHRDFSQNEPSSLVKTLAQMNNDFQEKVEPGEIYHPFRNPRLIPYLRGNALSETSYGALSTDVDTNNNDRAYRYQTLAADLLLNGAFNINSTSVDAWVSHLSSLKGLGIPNGTYPTGETPVPRFLKEREVFNFNAWDKIRSLSDDEISLLAYCLVEQIKLRGPFLSYADFVNRRIVGTPVNLIPHRIDQWDLMAKEDRASVLGLRGAVQAAIAEARINRSSYGASLSANSDNPEIPEVPMKRFAGAKQIHEYFAAPRSMNFLYSEFGIPAFSKSPTMDWRASDPEAPRKVLLQPEYYSHEHKGFNVNEIDSYSSRISDFGVGMVTVANMAVYNHPVEGLTENFMTPGGPRAFKMGYNEYEGAASLGEAPDNLLATEDCSTAANKPGWVMQSDILSPLAPVTSARSDTFVIRVMGENQKKDNSQNQGRAWIELTVQRTPDYIKSALDAPHHRPHEPFEDRNFNGYWDSDPSFREHWHDLNQNGVNREGTATMEDAQPDLPAEGIYPDGLNSDLPLNPDLEEEPTGTVISTMGINQRFGRKFKIVKFRWIKDQDV